MVASSHSDNSIRRVVPAAPLDVVQRVRGGILHEKASDADHSQMTVHRRIGRGAFLTAKTRRQDKPRSAGIGIRHPHSKLFHAIGQRCRKQIGAVNHLQGRDLAVGQTCLRARIRGIGIAVARAAFCGPGIASFLALFDIEKRAAGHVVIDDPVCESIQFVALPHEFAADGVHFGGSNPVGQRFFLNPDQFRRQHQRREAHDRHVRDDAVVIGGIPLSYREGLAAAL